MTTWKHFVARLLHQFEALCLSADIFEGEFHTWRWLLEFVSAESTRRSILLIAGLANVIRFSIALDAEVLPASVTAYSILSHVLGRLHREWLSLVVLLAPYHLTFNHFHHVAAGAADHAGVVLDQIQYLSLINLFLVVLGQELPTLEVLDLLTAPRAEHGLAC